MTPRTRSTPSRIVRALVAFAALAAVYAVAVLTPAGQAVDDRIMREVADALAGATWTSSVLATVSPLSLLLAAALIGLVAWAAKGWRAAGSVVAAVVVTVLAAQVLKAGLDRPHWWDLSGNSLPSGHVAAVAALAVALRSAAPRGLRRVSVVAGALAVAATGVATLALEWHRPSDVVASVLLAVGVGWLAAIGTERRTTTAPRSPAADARATAPYDQGARSPRPAGSAAT